MPKILFFCTHCNQGTGYGKSAAKLCNWLCANAPKDFELVYYAFQNYPGQNVSDRFIDPRIRFVDALQLDPDSPKGFGDKGIVPTVMRENPDMIFIYNNLSVTTSILEILGNDYLKTVHIAVFLDLVYPWEDFTNFDKIRHLVDYCFVYTQSWKEHLVNDLRWDENVVTPAYLGVDVPEKMFSQSEALKLLNLPEDSWIVLNMNRNSYRKQWCITIRAWFDFWIRAGLPPEVKLFIGCALNNKDGYDIDKLIRVECKKYSINPDVFIKNHIFVNTKPTFSTDETVNLIMAASSVGINTSLGEGYGMTNMEHALHGKPQIVPGVPSVKDVLGDVAVVVEPKVWTNVSNYETHGGEIALVDYKDYSDALLNIYRQGFSNAESYKNHVQVHGNWENNLKVFKIIFDILYFEP